MPLAACSISMHEVASPTLPAEVCRLVGTRSGDDGILTWSVAQRLEDTLSLRPRYAHRACRHFMKKRLRQILEENTKAPLTARMEAAWHLP